MTANSNRQVSGHMQTLSGERFYCINNVDRLPPFFISLVSAYDHWMFIASNGGLTAGRGSPDTALLPYVTVDKIYDSTLDTGPRTLLRVTSGDEQQLWEPFNRQQDDRYQLQRNLYKNWHGNKLIFEEVNHDLNLVFRYQWCSSDAFGFVRYSELESLGNQACSVELLDGLQNLLPAGTPRYTQTNSSYLVDAYKWNELDSATGLACYTLYSAITDRAEPCESLHASTVFALGLPEQQVLLSNHQIEAFRAGARISEQPHTRGLRGAYLVHARFSLGAGDTQRWELVANTERSQSDVVALQQQLANPAALRTAVADSVAAGSDALNRIIAASDGLQHTEDENLAAHHYANVLYNVMRGGIFHDHYQVSGNALRAHFQHFNAPLAAQLAAPLAALPQTSSHPELLSHFQQGESAQALRLALEYLPLTFGRRHGDPSRPWNNFNIKLRDDRGQPLLAYEGNWRDIFQNWEALLLSYPSFIESVIAKFVNASTIDGYNPYRITESGIDWEVEDEDDPWSYIGYWGDHQIIYLLKLLEQSQQFHPAALSALLHTPCFSYANVPYRLKPFADMLENAKSTVSYDAELAQRIEARVQNMGADGKLLLDDTGEVYLVSLLEKLLVPLLSKLGNLVVDGGIWLNTQRPEWNDANNALVGQGLSMVTLYYMRRYIRFLQPLLAQLDDTCTLSAEVCSWLEETAAALRNVQADLAQPEFSDSQRFGLLAELGNAASRYREKVYAQQGFSGQRQVDKQLLADLLDHAQTAIDRSIRSNRANDGLYSAYNTISFNGESARVRPLYDMLEGQVAVLSSRAIEPEESITLLQRLFASALYREDQKSFLLYPDKQPQGFLQKNVIADAAVKELQLLQRLLDNGDASVVERDAAGALRFNARLTNAGELDQALAALGPDYAELVASERGRVHDLYEGIFDHQAFTGRSGGMFGFEGLGSIYWHMVSKLLLAVQERWLDARAGGASGATQKQLGDLYYAVREGIGFNKTPAEYGAFPNDPYSHSPGHIGAQQPGMTGQVKEEVITRFNELGVRISAGEVTFDPGLLRAREFTAAAQNFVHLDIAGDWQDLSMEPQSLVFTWCQVPVVYRLRADQPAGLSVYAGSSVRHQSAALALPAELARDLFQRNGAISRIEISLTADMLFGD